jgi:hypothetical protein
VDAGECAGGDFDVVDFDEAGGVGHGEPMVQDCRIHGVSERVKVEVGVCYYHQWGSRAERDGDEVVQEGVRGPGGYGERRVGYDSRGSLRMRSR